MIHRKLAFLHSANLRLIIGDRMDPVVIAKLSIYYCREDEDKKERQEKFKRHEAEYVQHLKAKYFSNKTFTGGTEKIRKKKKKIGTFTDFG